MNKNKKEYDKKIVILREEIDLVDKKILFLLSQRISLVEKVGKLKKEFSIPPLQQNRFNSLLERLYQINREKNKDNLLDNKYIKDIWDRIHEESLKIEKK